jgi:hypothetical protein
MVRARATADSDMPFSSLGTVRTSARVERAEVLTTYLGGTRTCSGVSSTPPQIYDGRETSTREAPKDVRKPTL